MKKYLIFVLILQIGFVKLSAQELINPSLVGRDSLRNGNYLTPLNLLRQDEKKYLQSKWGWLYRQYIATMYSYVGQYDLALQYFDNFYDEDSSLSAVDTVAFEPVDAETYIMDALDTVQALFINESHHMQQHRILTLNLLKKLKEKGFSYFAAEAIFQADSLLQKRGYPIRGVSGEYLNEPILANMVREAIRLGFTIVAYDEAVSSASEREKKQAENMYNKIFKNDPKAKVIVHAGYAHIYEKEQKRKYMAQHFLEITGINPLTVNQTEMHEQYNRSKEKSYYRFFSDSYTFDKPMIFVSKKSNKVWVSPDMESYYDLEIFLPRTQYKDGRPQWLKYDRLKSVEISIPNKESLVYPILLQVFDASEDVLATPIDQILIENAQKRILVFTPGKNAKIRIIDSNGKRIIL
ncbi:hypothetical protein HUU42_14405 [bacterium]|nr:hypothetical protein [bacterium]